MTPFTEIFLASLLLLGGGASTYQAGRYSQEQENLQRLINYHEQTASLNFQMATNNPQALVSYNQSLSVMSSLKSGRESAERSEYAYRTVGTISYTLGGMFLIKGIYDYYHQGEHWTKGVEIAPTASLDGARILYTCKL